MSILFVDGFDIGDYPIKWSSYGSVALSTVTRFGTGRSLYASNRFMSYAYKNIPASDRVTVGFALRRGMEDSLGSNACVSFYGDNGATRHLTIGTVPRTGILTVRRGTGSGTILAISTTRIPMNVWTYVEIQATISDTTGSVEIRLNGSTTPEINLTNADTKNGGTNNSIDRVRIGGDGSTNNGSVGYFDDLYILDSLGTTNNTFLGDIRLRSIMPSANGTNSQFTGSDGDSVDNYAMVNKIPYSTTDYVAGSSTGTVDTYNMEDIPTTGISAIHGVQSNIIAATSADPISLKPALLVNGNLHYGTTNPLTTTYDTYIDIHDVNPETSVPWTPSDINDLEAGTEVV